MALESPNSILYEAIVERIKTTVPDIKYIDQDLGQMENYGDRPALSFPAVLIDLDEFEFSEVGSNPVQMADGFVVIRLAVPQWSSTAGFTPAGVREKALKYYEIEQKLIEKLHNWAPTGFNRLLRRKVRSEKRDDLYRVRIIAFQIGYKDESCVPQKQKVARPTLKTGIKD